MALLLLLLLISVPAFGQVPIISTVAGGFNPSAAASQNACLPIRAATFFQGTAYVESCNRIWKVGSQDNWTVVAGNGIWGFSGDGGPATSASIAEPRSVGVDAAGNVYILDEINARLREVAKATGIIQTIAGTGVAGYSGDGGQAVNAQINPGNRGSIFVNASTGDIYLSDTTNSIVRKITASTGIITTVAGTPGVRSFSGDGGPATSAKMRGPLAAFVDGLGNIFIADSGNNRIREVVAGTGFIQTVVGNGTAGFSGDGGPATSAELFQPDGVFLDGSNNIFISDQLNQRIREVSGGSGNIQTIAGTGATFPSSCNTSLDLCLGNGGPATSTIIDSPQSVWLDQGNLFIVTLVNGIEKIPSGTNNIQNFAANGAIGFSGNGGPAASAQLDFPVGAAADSAGNIFIADSDLNGDTGAIRKVVAATGDIQTIAGNEITMGLSGDGGPASAATTAPNGPPFVDSAGNIFIADAYNEIREIVASTGIIKAVAGNGTSGYSGDGGPATSAEVSFPTGVFVDSAGNIFIADEANHVVREVVASSGDIRTVAGNGISGFSGDGGAATSAELRNPESVWLDLSGNIFIADVSDNRIREVAGGPGGNIVTVAGNGTAGFSGDGGLATSAQLNTPYGVYGDNNGNIFVAEFGNNDVREFTVGGNIQTVAGNRVQGFGGDGGAATSAELDTPNAVFVEPSGSLLISEGFGRVRMVELPGSGSQPTSTALSSTPNPSAFEQSVTFTATVAASGTPTGSVTFLDNGSPIGSVALFGNGQATLATPSLTAGAHSIRAQYSGDPVFAGSTSSSVIEIVNSPETGDFFGNGTPAYAVFRPSNGTWYALDSKNPGNILVQQWGTSGDIPVRGDYDGDGKTDFAVFRPSTGQWFIIPSSNPGTPIVQNWGTNGDIPVPGDYDGDGKTDFAVWRPSTGTWYIIPSSNPGTPIVQNWGTNGDIPVPGDYDGDGKTDFAVWRPSTGTWYIIPSGTPGTQITQQWGTNGDMPVVGDYDGDGKTDFAVWRPSSGIWYIIPSSKPGTQIVQQWGTAGDIPVPADYDADGLTDIAVWRPSNGIWYVIPSVVPGTPTATPWGTSGDVPIQKPIGQ